MDEDWRVVHTSAENFDEIENNRQVLFSGTPCQCAELKRFPTVGDKFFRRLEKFPTPSHCHNAEIFSSKSQQSCTERQKFTR